MRFIVLVVVMLAAGGRAIAGPADDAIRASVADSKRLQPETAYLTRYLILDQDDQFAYRVLAFHLNQLSVNGVLVPPRKVAAGVVAVFIPDYDPDLKRWPKLFERLAELDPYLHEQKWFAAGEYAAGYYPVPSRNHVPAEHRQLMKLTQSYAPILRADWFVTQTCRQIDLNDKDQGVGYYAWLGVKDRATYEKLVGLQEAETLKRRRDIRAALDLSGVSQHNRQVEILQGFDRRVYKTLDSKSNVDAFDEKKVFRRQNAIQNLKRGEFDVDAEEHYGALPNGLFAYLLCDKDGKLQATAPDFIGPDRSPLNDTRDARIHVCLACVRCHVDGLRPIDCWVRRTIKTPLGFAAIKYKDLSDLRRQYGGDLEEVLNEDRAGFAKAVSAITGGWTVAENARHFARFYSNYAARLRGPDDIGRELGVAGTIVVEALKAYQTDVQSGGTNKPLPNVVAGLLQTPPTPLRPEYWEENYQTVAAIVLNYKRNGE